MGAIEKLHYAGDVLGFSEEGKVLVLGRICDPDWPFDFSCGDIPYIPKQSLDLVSIEWPPGKRLPLGVKPIFLDRPFVKIGTKIRHKGIQGIVKGKVDVATVRIMGDTICLCNVELDRLIEITEARRGRQFLLSDYIGEIESVKHKVLLAFDNGVECYIDYDRDRCLYKGVTFTPSYGDLRSATWSSSGFHNTAYRMIQNLGSTARITEITVDSLTVKWVNPIPSETESAPPPQNLSREDYGKICFLPERCDNPELNTLWKIEIVKADLENVFDSTEDWLNELMGGGVVAGGKQRRLDLSVLAVGSTQTVQLLLIQTNVQIEYDDGTTANIPSRELEAILTLNSVEIPRSEFVLKLDQTPEDSDSDGQLFGLVREYYPGEAQQTSMNPLLNPSNMKEVQWFKLDKNNAKDIQASEVQRVSVYDLQSMGLSCALENTDYLTRQFPDDELKVGSFSRILDNGMIEVKDLDGKVFQRWPNALSIFEPIFSELVRTISLPLPLPEAFLKAAPCDLEQTGKYFASTTSIIRSKEGEPINQVEFLEGINRNLVAFADTSESNMHKMWIRSYKNQEDLFSCLMMGREGSIVEDLVFLIMIDLPRDFPSGSPRFCLSTSSTLENSFLGHWDDLIRHSFLDWNKKDLILHGLSNLRNYIESTAIVDMKIGNDRFPISYVYPKIDHIEGNRNGWAQRWNEVIAIQSMRYVYNTVAYPVLNPDYEILGHYRRVLPKLLDRWKSWTRNEGIHLPHVSEGFISATENQIRRFEKLLATDIEKEKPRCKECGRPEDPAPKDKDNPSPDPDPEVNKDNPKDDPK